MIAVRWKALPWVLALCLLAFSLVAANRLLHTDEEEGVAAPGAPPKKDAKPAKPAPAVSPNPHGLTVLGTVDAPNGIGRVDAPAFPAASGATVVAVLVHEGQEVKIGDVLLQFDDSAYVLRLKQAEAALSAAQWESDKARIQKELLRNAVDLQKLAIKKAERDRHYAKEGYDRAREMFEALLAADKMRTDVEKDRQRRHNLELLKAEQQADDAELAVDKAQKELAVLEAKPVEADVQLAAAKINGATAAVGEAKSLIEMAKVKARSAGIVERLSAQAGMTFGPATRTPALYIVPTGARIVRAEIEAEFAHKINDRVGKTVTICDSHNFTHTYEGRVARIGTSYLPKRGSAENFTVNPTQVLECEIEVTDPTPAGKPPLRVGQPVRVVFGP